jgi:hypothetical protein
MSLWCTQGHLAWQQRIEKEITAATRSIASSYLDDPEHFEELRNTLKNRKTERRSRHSMDLDLASKTYSNHYSRAEGKDVRESSLPSISRNSRHTANSKVQSLMEKHSSSTKSSISQNNIKEEEELMKLKEQLYQEKKLREKVEEELNKLREIYYKQN